MLRKRTDEGNKTKITCIICRKHIERGSFYRQFNSVKALSCLFSKGSVYYYYYYYYHHHHRHH
jgi:hypothetical protein